MRVYNASCTAQSSLEHAIGATAAQETKRMRERRILLYMGIGLAHDMTHCMRLIVSSSYWIA